MDNTESYPEEAIRNYARHRADPNGLDPTSVIGVPCLHHCPPPFRRHGIASALLDRVIGDASAVHRGSRPILTELRFETVVPADAESEAHAGCGSRFEKMVKASATAFDLQVYGEERSLHAHPEERDARCGHSERLAAEQRETQLSSVLDRPDGV